MKTRSVHVWLASGCFGLIACSKPAPPVAAPPPAAAPVVAAAPDVSVGPSPAQLAQAEAASTAAAAAGPTTDGFVVVPAGSFTMGVPADEGGQPGEVYNDAPAHPVTISRSFEMHATEVTQAAYGELMGATEAQRTGCATCPVANVSWLQAVTYCNQLSKRRNLPSCYLVAGTDATFVGLTCRGYRLPTEAEWEYAARAGTTGKRYGDLDAIGWIDTNSGQRPQPVRGKVANGWGLYDMIGNVFEWTHDWQAEYPKGPVTDPTGPAGGQNKVFRGGGFPMPESEARAGFRNAYGPMNQVAFVGFRCVRTLVR